MKNSFSRWYAEEAQEALDQGLVVNDVRVDLRATVVKPLHENWLISAITTLSDKKDTLKKTFWNYWDY